MAGNYMILKIEKKKKKRNRDSVKKKLNPETNAWTTGKRKN